jgi:hypothetical protein
VSAQVIPFRLRPAPTVDDRPGVESLVWLSRYVAGLVVHNRDHGRHIPTEVDQALGTLLDWLVTKNA